MNVGIEDLALTEKSVDIYPNPSNGEVSVSVATNAGLEVNVSVLDMIGKEYSHDLHRFTPGNNTYRLDLNHLSGGIYMLRLESNGKVFSKKFIIEK